MRNATSAIAAGKKRLAAAAVVAAFALALLAAFVPASAWAADDIASGTSGTCDWVIDSDGVLTISPSDGVEGYLDGNMSSKSSSPWYSYRTKITEVNIEEGAHAGEKASYLFYGLTNATSFGGEGVEDFVTSTTTALAYMFYNCSAFTTLDLSGWDTSNVTTLYYMFYKASGLESLTIGDWDTSSVTTMAYAFYGCTSLAKIDLSEWDVSSVTTMARLFYNCSSLTELDFSSWNLSSATSLSYLVSGCTSLETVGDLSKWNTSNVTDMSCMFYLCPSLETVGDLSAWDVSKVEDMAQMFYGCTVLESVGSLSSWNTSSVEDMSFMFRECAALTSLDLSNWDTSSVTTLRSTFYGCTSLETVGDISDWNVANLDSSGVKYLFYGCSSLTELDLSGWNISSSKVSALDNTFEDCSSLESIDLSGWDTSNVTSTKNLFDGCSKLSKVVLGSGWDCWTSSSSSTSTGSLPTPSTSLGTWICADCSSSIAGTSYTARELAINWVGDTYAGTWYWETSLEVSVTASSEADTVTPGDSVTWTIMVTNTDKADAYNVAVLNELPEGVEISGSISSSIEDSSLEYSADEETGESFFTISVDELAAGETWTISFTVLASDETDSLVNAATASADNASEETASASVVVDIPCTVVFDLNYDCDESKYATVEVTYGVETPLSVADPERSCYAFAGWNTVADGSGTSYATDDDLSDLFEEDGAKVTLYAQWTLVGHTYGEGVVTEPTCTEGGYTTYTCTACGESYTDNETEATGHSWDEGAVTTEATCTADGVMTYTCTACGETSSETIAATGHSWGEGVVTEPTCTEGGYTTYTCTTCGESYTDNETEATGHTYKSEVTTEATCTEDGVMTYTCTACGDSYTEAIDATGHTYKSEVTTEATCTEDGVMTYTCTACGDSYTEVINATGHAYESVVTEPTCTEAGYTTYTCIYCGKTYTDDENEALGHDYDSVVTTKATCTTDGVETFTCGTCGDTYTKTIAATGHTYGEGVVTEPTCTEGGYTTYTCTACGESYTDDETEALGHSFDYDGIEWAWTEAEDGSWSATATVACSACGEAETVEADVEAEATEATCTEDGSVVYTASITVGEGDDAATYACGESKTVTVEAAGHAYGEGVVENEVEATCTEAGSYDSVVYCSVCGAELSRETVTVEATGHDWQQDGEAVWADDYSSVSIAIVCANDETHTATAEASGDDEISYEVTAAATCTEAGEGVYSATVSCGGQEFSVSAAVEIAALGHSFDYEDVAWSWAEDYSSATATVACSACGEAASAEAEVTSEAVEPTCNEEGAIAYTATATFEDGTAVAATVTVALDAAGHTAAEAVVENEVAATCTADGSYDSVVYCSVCGAELSRETVAVDATGHDWGEGVVTGPTCTEDGCTTYTCTVCGESYTDDETEAAGHTYESEVTTEPTCTEEGVTTYTCTVCGDSYEEAIGATGHVEAEAVVENLVEATATTGGSYDLVVYCSVCGEELSRETVAVAAEGEEEASLVFIELAGDLRYDTMAEIVAQAYEGASSEYAVLATGENFPDALTASSLAGALGCPVVLVGGYDAAIEAAAEAIEAVGATKIYVVGGTSAVSDETVDAVLEATGAALVERLYGDTRQETALAIAQETLALTDVDSTVAIVSTGENFPDVLSASAYSYWAAAPIYLTELDGTLSDETLSAIEEAGYEQVIIIGGDAVVSDEAEEALEALGLEVERLYGDDRYETCEAVVEWCLDEGMSYDGCAVATGENFPDALAGSVLCGRAGSVILLASDDSVACADGLAANIGSIGTVYFLGGDAAVSQDARDAVAEALGVEYEDVVVVIE